MSEDRPDYGAPTPADDDLVVPLDPPASLGEMREARELGVSVTELRAWRSLPDDVETPPRPVLRVDDPGGVFRCLVLAYEHDTGVSLSAAALDELMTEVGEIVRCRAEGDEAASREEEA